MYKYEEAISRNSGFILEKEQDLLRNSTIAIAGMGGVGASHLVTLARLGFSKFKISDMDIFETGNFNRQAGAFISTVNVPKVDAMKKMILDINPEAEIELFSDGIDSDNVDEFLSGVDMFLDGLDFFVLNIRQEIFAKCHKMGIPAITAAPTGWGTTYIVFSPDGMSFDDFFSFEEGLDEKEKYIRFYVGLLGKKISLGSLIDPTGMNIKNQRLSSTASGVYAASAAITAQAVKVLLKRGDIKCAPYYHQVDFYNNRFAVGILRNGNKSIVQKIKLRLARKAFKDE
ncbi:MAG: molybdopterin/thiamine biosynthesis adenylyltransferase [Alphaproteobacteria bacterium]|jgi:molybdopterin/thiamine biosynthesis adenylyltransferase